MPTFNEECQTKLELNLKFKEYIQKLVDISLNDPNEEKACKAMKEFTNLHMIAASPNNNSITMKCFRKYHVQALFKQLKKLSPIALPSD